MSDNLQYRLQQYETAPPADLWHVLAEKLDKEFDLSDNLLSSKVLLFEQPAPPGAWNKILADLQSTSHDTGDSEKRLESPVIDIRQPAETRTLPARLQRIAAAALLCIALAAVYYYFSGNRPVTSLTFTNNPANKKAGLLPAVIPSSVQKAEITASPRTTLAGLGGSRMLFRKKHSPVVTVHKDAVSFESESNDISYATISTAGNALSSDNIVIPTQPIRDAQGKIIMDETLITSPDGNYVTVTCPNGEQTKISKKFLHALSYMNVGSTDEDNMGIMLQESSLWKWLFKEWRQKLLSQPSFIPSATNFLDIMELKEILHENF